ncbi:hypothetical protein HII13_003053 [Brettanomyces bruxellensis]|nr:hypothetical protein HII13_003053 [Brettanomyces bruxellensis]
MPFGLLTEILFCLTSASAFSVKQFMKDGQTQILNEPIPGESPLELCDSLQPQILTLDSLKMDPVPPERGENLTIIASGTLSAPVEEGAYVDVDVDYGLIKLIHATYDLCEELPNVDMKCPIKKGHYELNKRLKSQVRFLQVSIKLLLEHTQRMMNLLHVSQGKWFSLLMAGPCWNH